MSKRKWLMRALFILGASACAFGLSAGASACVIRVGWVVNEIIVGYEVIARNRAIMGKEKRR